MTYGNFLTYCRGHVLPIPVNRGISLRHLGLATDIDPNDPALQIKYDEKEMIAEIFTRISLAERIEDLLPS